MVVRRRAIFPIRSRGSWREYELSLECSERHGAFRHWEGDLETSEDTNDDRIAVTTKALWFPYVLCPRSVLILYHHRDMTSILTGLS